jgi:CcmD family protein
MIKKIIPISLLSLIYVIDLNAQTEMADGMRTNGKIYVVVVVLATIFAGIFAYLWKLERKISKLEKEKQKNNF